MSHYVPASTESLLLSLRSPIALVGNGNPGRPLGSIIDRYPSVIRFNDFQLEGFQELVGSRTTVRAVNGWTDIEVRDGVIAMTPFTGDAPESAHLEDFRRRSMVPVLCATTDVHVLLPDIPKPSTGLSLAALASSLGLEIDCFGFDGFATGHYWNPTTALHTTHSRFEAEQLLRLPGVTLYGQSFDYASLYDFCHTEHADYGVNEGLTLCAHFGLTFPGERVLEFGAGNGALAMHLQRTGSRVTAVEVSPAAFSSIAIADKMLGDALTLGTINETFDRFVSFDVLEHLTENDVRIVAREAARVANNITISVCTRPSGLTGPSGENLHLTVRPVSWWLDLFSNWFDISVSTGTGIGQLVMSGTRRQQSSVRQSGNVTLATSSNDALALPPNYTSRLAPEYFHDTLEVTDGITWQPDVYHAAAELARTLGCRTIVDVGCGQARKLVALHPEFRIIGIDFGTNIEYCRDTYTVGSWLESDLESHALLPIPAEILKDAVVVCADVIEHLVDPRPLLATIGDLLAHAAYAIVTTPDRERTHGAQHRGPPPNPAHVREWTAAELGTLCVQEGLNVAAIEHTRSNDVVPDLATSLIVLGSPKSAPLAAPAAGADSSEIRVHARDIYSQNTTIPSAQTGMDGQPRFWIPAMLEHPDWAAAAMEEANGGVDADIRIYLDEQITGDDVLVDAAPGFGFVALSALTAPQGTPTVLVADLENDYFTALQAAAGTCVDALEAVSLEDWTTLAAITESHLAPTGRVVVHLMAAQVPGLLASLAPLLSVDRVMAVCVRDPHTSLQWPDAAIALAAFGFLPCAVGERLGEIIVHPIQGPPTAQVIALPSHVMDACGIASRTLSHTNQDTVNWSSSDA